MLVTMTVCAYQQWRWGGARCKGHPPPHFNNISQRLEALVTAALHQQRHAEVACLEPLAHLHCAKGAYSEKKAVKKLLLPSSNMKATLKCLQKHFKRSHVITI